MIIGFAIILLGGFISGRLFKSLGLPALLGALALGVLMGPYYINILPEGLLSSGADLRMIALIIILLRAGLGLDRELLAEVGSVALRMSFLPCLLEGSVATAAAMYFLKMPFAEAGMLGFILAAVSPAVVVPAMLSLQKKGLGMAKGVPVIVLAGAALDDAFAITLFSAFVGLASQGTFGGPLQVPLQLVWAVLGGVLMGLGAFIAFRTLSRWLKASRAEDSMLALGLALGAAVMGEHLAASGPLAALVFGFILLEKLPRQASRVDQHLTDLWVGAQLMLFVLIGAAVQVPLIWSVGLLGSLVLALGLLARSGGVFLALIGSELNIREKLFVALAYSPKATVQAAIGGVPLALGFASGPAILAIAVLSIAVTAPLGAIAIEKAAPLLLQQSKRNTPAVAASITDEGE